MSEFDSTADPVIVWIERAKAAEARLAEAEAALREIDRRHQPSDVKEEIEVWHDLDEECPAPDPRDEHCPGHYSEIVVCVECGTVPSEETDGWAYREWPCWTHKLVARAVLAGEREETAEEKP